MSELSVYKHGELIKTLSLEEEKEYFLGRGNDCDVVLDGATGISRKHFKISSTSPGQWTVELLSKFGQLYHKGANVSEINLSDGDSFSLQPFEFSYLDPQENKSSLPAVAESEEPPASNIEKSGLLAPISEGLTSRTTLGAIEQTPYLKLIHPSDQRQEVLRLEGNVWIAGRDEACEILIKERGVSRHHFELSQAGEAYYLRDLDSANGTMLNGRKILPDQPVPLKSGDVINVLALQIHFQIRDPSYNEKLDLVPAAMLEPIGQPQVPVWQGANLPQEYQTHAPPAPFAEPPPVEEKPSSKKAPIRIAAAAILLLALWIGLSEPSPTDEQRKPSNVSEAYINLPQDQREIISNSYNVAKELIIKEKCQLALPELRRIHELIPFYKDSKQIESDCQQQLETIKLYEELQLRKRMEAETLRQVDAAVARCEGLMNDKTSLMDLNNCLGDEGSLIPEHAGVQRLKLLIEERELEKNRKAVAQEEYNRKVSRGRNLYNKASGLEKRGEAYKALNAYKRFLNAGMPDPRGLRPRARRSIASLSSSMSSRVETLIEQALEQADQLQFNQAMELLSKADKIDPTSAKLKDTRNRIEVNNDKEMKILYSDSVLEESLGNIESAKDRWRKIIEISYTKSNYYRKARSKLRKYGEL